MPVLTVVAGPNGSGKSTITANSGLRSSATLIDPDAIAHRLNPADPSRAAIQAARDAILLCRSMLAQRWSFVVETTLAGNGPLATIRDAIEAGYKTYVVYVALAEADLNAQRVGLRVLHGGHDVPDDDVRRRYTRSLQNAPEALRIAHRAVVVDNSGRAPRRILTVRRGQIFWRAPDLPRWVEAIAQQLSIHSC